MIDKETKEYLQRFIDNRISENEQTNEKRKIFITITLYLLLALAFFSNYFVGDDISSVGTLIFILGILTLIPLTIIYTRGFNIKWAYRSISPFILIILFNLTLLYGKSLGITTSGGMLGFVVFLEELFWKIIQTESIQAVFFLMLFLGIILVGHIIYKRIKKLRNE